MFSLTTGGVPNFPHIFDISSGSDPFGGLTLAGDGSFYGTTGFGGSMNNGVLFQVTPSGGYTVLHEFQGGSDGAVPAAPPIMGTDGSLYGTTNGNSSTPSTIYKYTPASGTLTTIYQFDQDHGQFVTSPLIQATDGNLYGTAFQGGANNCGTIFKLTTSGSLLWYYSFPCGQGGANPIGPLLQAADGNFYGTTRAGQVVAMASEPFSSCIRTASFLFSTASREVQRMARAHLQVSYKRPTAICTVRLQGAGPPTPVPCFRLQRPVVTNCYTGWAP
jgi:uncharacterized repeat protein (TIGR03803 family)